MSVFPYFGELTAPDRSISLLKLQKIILHLTRQTILTNASLPNHRHTFQSVHCGLPTRGAARQMLPTDTQMVSVELHEMRTGHHLPGRLDCDRAKCPLLSVHLR